MVAIVTGIGLGLQRTSGWVLGSNGQIGSASLGRAGDGVSLNAATGNLVIANTDEMLFGLGPNEIVGRTYNSLTPYNDHDNGDQWQQSYARHVEAHSGAYNTAGSTVTLIDWDGSDVVYTWDGSYTVNGVTGAYVDKSGTDAYDALQWQSGSSRWQWTDGATQTRELFETDGATYKGRIVSRTDPDGNALSFTYTSNLLTRVMMSDGVSTKEYTDFTYSGTDLVSLTTYRHVATDGSDALSPFTRVTYGYDTSQTQHRLTSVTVDLTPANTSDNSTYTTNYAYEGTSNRVSLITQTDGTSLAIAYDPTSHKVTQLTQTVASGVTRVTGISYGTNTTTITDSGGYTTVLNYNSAGQLTSIVRPAPTASGSSTLTTTFSYATVGDDHVLTVSPPSSKTVTYTYDNRGNRISEVDNAGDTIVRKYDVNTNALLNETRYLGGGTNTPATTRYAYDGEDHLRYAISAEGRVTEYIYDTPGNLIRTIEYAGNIKDVSALMVTDTLTLSDMNNWVTNTPVTVTNAVLTDYDYDYRGNLKLTTSYDSLMTSSATTADGVPLRVAPSSGAVTSTVNYIYDQAGNLLKRMVGADYEQFYYDGLNRITSSRDFNGVITSIAFGDSAGTTTVTLAGGLIRTSTYDKAGELTSYAESGTGVTTATTSYRYDVLGRVRSVTDPTGLSTYVLYDHDGRRVADIAADGTMVEYQYNVDSQLIATIAYKNKVASPGALTNTATADLSVVELSSVRPTSDSADRWSWNVYDSAARLVETIDAAGAATVYAYDGASRLISTTQYANPIAAATVTGFKTTAPTSIVTPTADSANDRVTRAFYDKDDLLQGTLDAQGYLTKIIYDGARQKIETIGYATQVPSADRATGAFTTLVADVTTGNLNDIHNYFLYDARGLVRASIDGEGDLTRYSYDALGNLLMLDRGQKVTAASSYTLSGLPAAGSEIHDHTVYDRDLYGRLRSEQRWLNTTGSSYEVDTYGYSTDGLYNLVSKTTTSTVYPADTRTITNRYDKRGRLTGTVGGVGSATIASTSLDTAIANYGTIYVYDDADRMIRKIEADGAGGAGNKTLYFYDADGRLTHSVRLVVVSGATTGEVTEYRYNTFGQVSDTIVYGTRLTDGGGTPLTGASALTGGLIANATGLTTALAALANSTKDSTAHADFNVTGTVSQTIDAMGAVTSFAYNAFRQVTTETDQLTYAPDTLTYVQKTFAYDRRGQLLNSTFDASGLNLVTAYVYDAFGRATQVTDPNGNVRLTAYDRANRISGATDALNKLTTYGYDGRGVLTSRTDRLGNTTTYGLDQFERTTTMTTPQGIVVVTTVNAFGQTKLITDGAGRQTSYDYDADGNLVSSIIDPDLYVGDPNHQNLQSTAAYDKAGRLWHSVDANGVTTTYSYDAADRVLSIKVDDGGLNLTTFYEYDAKGLQTKVTDASGVVTQVTYDLDGRQVKVQVDPTTLNLTTAYTYRADGSLTKVQQDPSGLNLTTQNTYDSAGRLLTTVVDPANLALTTTYTYDKNGNVTVKKVKIDATHDAVTRYAYDAEDQLIWTVDPVGDVIKTDYDAEGRVIAATAYAGAVASATFTGWGVTAVTASQISGAVTSSANDEVTRYVYNKDGQVRYQLDANLRATEFVYDNAGNVVRSTDYAAPISAPANYLYDTIDPMVQALAGNTANRTTRAIFDSANRQTYSIDAVGAVTKYEYDGVGRLLKRTDYLNSLTGTYLTNGDLAGLSPSSSDRVTRTIYDNAGRVAYTMDALGALVGYAYDGAGRVVKSTAYAAFDTDSGEPTFSGLTNTWVPAHAVSANDRVTRAYYDTAGRAVYSVDALGYATERQYDAASRVTGTIQYTGVYSPTDATNTSALKAMLPASPPADAAVTTYAYDAAGRLTSQTRAYGAATAYTYDGASRLITTTNAIGGVTTNQYDAAGRKISVTVKIDATTNAVTSYKYDTFGNQVKVTDPRLNSGFFYYDKLNRLIRQVDPEGFVTDTTYSIGDQTTSVTRYAAALSASVMSTLSETSTWTTTTPAPDAKDETTAITRDKLDRVTETLDAEGYKEIYELNAFGERTKVTKWVTKAPALMAHETTNSYDRDGQLITQSQKVVTPTDSTGVNIVNTFAYDAFGETTQTVEAGTRTTTYTYDKLGRVTAKTGQSVAVLANVTDTSTTNVMPTEQTVYDSRGNVWETIDAAGNATFYYYDLLDRKVAQVDALGDYSSWGYDGVGNVTSSRVYDTVLTTLPTTPGFSAPTAPSSTYRQTTFTYDLASRQTGTSVAGVVTGQYSGASYSAATTTVTTSTWYDLAGNVIKQTDGRGANVYSFYDKRGKKVLQVDQEGYVTAYVKGDTDSTLGLNTDGNVMAERRYATKISTTTLDGYTQTQLAAATASSFQPSPNSTNDRVTEFTYDRNGHRTQEKRKHVAYSSVDGAGAVTSSADADAIINYVYNGLGEVVSKQEATGDITTYVYDSMGRLLTETGPAFTAYVDAANPAKANQHRQTAYAYDGLNNVLSTTIRRVDDQTVVSDTDHDQVTNYAYDAAGRLTSASQMVGTTASFTRSYAYDVLGRVVREQYDRQTNLSGTPVTEANVTKYDALGRAVMQAKATYSTTTSSWTIGDQTQLRYNSHGEVTGKGVNVSTGTGHDMGGAYQETFDYDGAGRLWYTNSGNGAIKLYISDAAGNVTMQITSTGGDLSGYTASTLASALSASNAVQTISVYDKRGKATATLAPSRTIADSTSFATTTQDLTTAQAYNAFGEVTSQTDSRNVTTTFSYNTMGRLVQTTHASVNVTSASGVTTAQTPIEYSAYDLGGRLVMVTDANGNVSKRQLMAGTGYGGSDPTVLKEFRADSTTSVVAYDVYGNDRRSSILFNSTELQVETRDYDRQGNLTVLTRPSRGATNPGGALAGLVEYYGYDGLGQRIKHWNSLLVDGGNNPLVEKTDYDAQGRVVRQVDFMGYTTTTTYAWDELLTTSGMGVGAASAATFGGWTKTVTSPAIIAGTTTNRTTVDHTDYFGHTTSHTDLGAHTQTSTYNRAGWLMSVGPLTYSYYNTGLMATMTDANAVPDVYFKGKFPLMTYESSKTLIGNFFYDANGNRVGEQLDAYVVGWRDYLDSEHQPVHEEVDGTYNVSKGKGSYDVLNRLTQYVSGTAVTVNLKYDAVGNIRNVNSVFYYVGAGATTTQDYWYKYDSMNRFTTTMGQLSGGVISRGTAGVGKDITYDGAGQRASVTTTTVVSGININHVETYSYTEDGYLTKVNIQDGTGYNLTRAIDIRDKMGRVLTHTEYLSNGSINPTTGAETLGTVEYNRYNVVYDADSKVISDATSSIVSGNTYVAYTTYDYLADAGGGVYTGAYQGGQLIHTQTTNYKNGTLQPTSSYNYDFLWQDAARQNWIDYKPDVTVSSNNHTEYTYDELGHLARVYINDGRPRTIEYATDLMGQVVSRTEYSGYPGAGTTDGPKSLYYYFNGRAIGDISNDGPSSYDYATSISRRANSPSTNAWRNGSSINYANFDDNYAAINPASQGEAPTGSAISVKDGDTLQSIAASVWGDSSLWYLIADANGLDSTTPLVSGMTLTVPAKVTNLHNSSSTFRVYNPNEAIGDVQPNQPKPPTKKDGACGDFGRVLSAVIAIVVTQLTGIPALGNIASQLFNMAAGYQDKFSWKSLAITELASVVSFGVDKLVSLATAGQAGSAAAAAASAGRALGSALPSAAPTATSWILEAAKAAASNALTQGIAVGLHLQDKFDWAGVGSAAVQAGVSRATSNYLNNRLDANINAGGMTPHDIRSTQALDVAVSGTAGLIASAATRSILSGTSFGDNLMQVLPDVLVTVGNLARHEMAIDAQLKKEQLAFEVDWANHQPLSGAPGGSANLWDIPQITAPTIDLSGVRYELGGLGSDDAGADSGTAEADSGQGTAGPKWVRSPVVLGGVLSPGGSAQHGDDPIAYDAATGRFKSTGKAGEWMFLQNRTGSLMYAEYQWQLEHPENLYVAYVLTDNTGKVTGSGVVHVDTSVLLDDKPHDFGPFAMQLRKGATPEEQAAWRAKQDAADLAARQQAFSDYVRSSDPFEQEARKFAQDPLRYTGDAVIGFGKGLARDGIDFVNLASRSLAFNPVTAPLIVQSNVVSALATGKPLTLNTVFATPQIAQPDFLKPDNATQRRWGYAATVVEMVVPGAAVEALSVKTVARITPLALEGFEPVVTAEARVGSRVFTDVNPHARIGGTANQPTLIADDIAAAAKPGQNPPNTNMANAHAEIGAMQQAHDAGLTSGADMTMTVSGLPLCSHCLSDVKTMAQASGLNSLKIYQTVTGETLQWTAGAAKWKKW